MAAWQSGTHGEVAGTLACAGPSVASSALRFAGRTGAPTMTSGSPTSAMALTSPVDTAGKRPGGGRPAEVTRSAPRAPGYLCHSIMTRGAPRKKEKPTTTTKRDGASGSPRLKAFTRRSLSLAPFKQRRETHNSTTFHTKSATVVKSISHYL